MQKLLEVRQKLLSRADDCSRVEFAVGKTADGAPLLPAPLSHYGCGQAKSQTVQGACRLARWAKWLVLRVLPTLADLG